MTHPCQKLRRWTGSETITTVEQRKLAHTALLRAADRLGATWDEAREIADMCGLIDEADGSRR